MINYSAAVQRQRDFFNSDVTKPVDFRIVQLKKLQSLLQSNEQILYKAIYDDFKKSEFDTYASELSQIYDNLRLAINNVKQWAKHKPVKTNFFNIPGSSFIVPEPLGVSLI